LLGVGSLEKLNMSFFAAAIFPLLSEDWCREFQEEEVALSTSIWLSTKPANLECSGRNI
jgi:hypothetical protein